MLYRSEDHECAVDKVPKETCPYAMQYDGTYCLLLHNGDEGFMLPDTGIRHDCPLLMVSKTFVTAAGVQQYKVGGEK